MITTISISLTIGIIIGAIINHIATRTTDIGTKHEYTNGHSYKVGDTYFLASKNGDAISKRLVLHVESDKVFYSIQLELTKPSDKKKL